MGMCIHVYVCMYVCMCVYAYMHGKIFTRGNYKFPLKKLLYSCLYVWGDDDYAYLLLAVCHRLLLQLLEHLLLPVMNH